MIAPALSAIGLVLVTALTVGLFTGRVPLPIPVGDGGGGGGGGVVDPNRTPPPVIVVPNEDVELAGSIVYVKSGNIWVQSGRQTRQLTNTGRDSMPSFSPDGQWIYFVETREKRGLYPEGGRPVYYDLAYPIVTRIRPDGTDRQALLSGLLKQGTYEWSAFCFDPVAAPNGSTLALVTDAPDPSRSDVVLQMYDLETKKLTAVAVPEDPPLGHQDPAWRPDGKVLLYVKNGRDGSRGTPSIWRYVVANGRFAAVTGPGYMAPSWSPNGKYIAATKTTSFGTDIVLLDAATGTELLRVSDDGASWGPTWSPRGDQVVYMHLAGQAVDLKLATLKGTAPNWVVDRVDDLTEFSGLDGASRASWYIAPDRLPSSSPSPSAPGGSATP